MKTIYLIFFTLILGAAVISKAQAQTCPDNIVVTADTDDCTTFINFDGPEGAWYVYSGATTDTTEYSQGQFYSGITYADVYNGHPDTGTWICQFEIEADDQTDPTAVCRNVTIEVNENGDAIFDASELDGGSTDNCSGNLIFTVDGSEYITYDCNDAGQTHEVTLVVTDPGGNSDECRANITIQDNISPVATCDGGVISLDAAGVTVRALDYETASSDNCGIDDSWFVVNGENYDQLTFDCSSHGVDSIVYYVVQDPSGLRDTCKTFTLELRDNEDPVLTYNPDTTIYLDEFGKAGLANTNWFEGVADNCGVYEVKFMDYSLPDSLSTKWVNTLHFECEVFTDSVIYLTVADVNGNFYTFDSLFRLTVLDTIAPTIKCVGDTTISLDEFGKASIIEAGLITTLTDNCTDSLNIIDDYSSLGTTNYSCADLGENKLTLEVQDEFGNLSTCEVTVNVATGDYSGGADPTCKLTTNAAPYILYLDEDGGAELIADSLNVNSTDACGNSDSLTFELVNAEFSDSWSCEDVDKTHALDVRVTDIYDNSTTCTAYVLVKDIPPEAVCQPATVYLDENGSATITDVSLVDYGSTDNCGIDTMYLTSNVFDCNDLGLNASPMVALTVEDVNGNSSTCWAEVTVLDTIKPIVPSYSITAENDPGLCCATVEFPDLMQELIALGQEGITLPDAPLSQGGVAYNPIKKLYYATRAGANSNYTINTYDETGSQLAANIRGFDFRGLWWNPNVSSLEGGSYRGNGYRNVDLDDNGYALSTGTNDPTSNYQPHEQSQADYDYMADEVIYYFNSRIYRTSRASGDSLGSYRINGLPARTLNWTFIGFTGITGAEILVYDYSNKEVYFFDKSTGAYSHSVQLPASAPGQNFLNTSYANGYIWISDGSVWRSYKVTGGEAGISDNCGIASIEFSHSEENCFPVGRTEVTFTVTDASGNTSHGSMFVNVKDTENPVAECQDITVYLDETGNATITAGDIDDGSTDNCEIVSRELDVDAFDCGDIGETNVVELTLTDSAGNNASCTSAVTVLDTLAPVIDSKDHTVYLQGNGEYVLSEAEKEYIINRGEGITAANCTAPEDIDITITPVTFECLDAGTGPVEITITATDEYNNESVGMAYVTVIDTFAPLMNCKDTLDVYLDENGEALIFPGDLNEDIDLASLPEWASTLNEPGGATWDACGIDSTWVSKQIFDCSPVGTPDTVMLWAADPNENLSSCSTIVMVHDTIAPTISIDVADTVMVVAEPGEYEVEITYPDVMAMDNCDATLTQVEGLGPDGMFPPGATTETWVAVDAYGNTSAEASFVVMVAVTPVNGAPFLVSPIADQTVNASYELTIAMSDAPGEYFDDPDGDMLTLTATLEDGSALPVWAEVVGDTLYAAPMIADTGCYNIVVEASDGELTATDSFRVCVEGYPTAIDHIGAGEFEVRLYPNPTQGMVNVDTDSSTARDIELTVFDITGKQVLRKQFSAAERVTFDMSGKVSGMYFVKLDFEGQQVLKKLIVDRK